MFAIINAKVVIEFNPTKENNVEVVTTSFYYRSCDDQMIFFWVKNSEKQQGLLIYICFLNFKLIFRLDLYFLAK